MEDVLDGPGEVVFVLDEPGREALAEQVAPALVAAVERLRVDAVQALHSGGEVLELRLDDEVVVVRHQAEDVDSPVVAVDDGREQAQEEAALIVVQEDRRARYSPRCDVVDPERGELVSRATHAANVVAARPQATSQRTARGQTAALLSHQAWPLQPTRRDSPWWERWWRRRAQPARRSTRR